MSLLPSVLLEEKLSSVLGTETDVSLKELIAFVTNIARFSPSSCTLSLVFERNAIGRFCLSPSQRWQLVGGVQRNQY